MIRMVAMTISRFCVEKDFMFIDGFSDLDFFVSSINSTAMVIIVFFLIFVFSFGAIDVVYINNVIIPDENVMITTKGSHLDMHSL